MTYDQMNLTAYDEARRAFRDMMLYRGFLYESALEKRREVYEESKRSRCTACGLEKHVSAFQGKTETTIQSWCRQCTQEYVRLRHVA